MLAGCGGGGTASSGSAAGSAVSGGGSGSSGGPVAKTAVPGWPAYIAMGAIGGPDVTPPTATSTGGSDDFGGRPVDVVFKYAGVDGNGDPGVIDPPTNAYRMTRDFDLLSAINQHPTRVAMVEYTSQMSGGFSLDDFTDGPPGLAAGNPAASYVMARHFASLGADAMQLASEPVRYNQTNYYGALIMNPDLLGTIEQNNLIAQVNAALPSGAVNTAVAQALCLLTTPHGFTVITDPNGNSTAPYVGRTFSGTPVQILQQMLSAGYPEWSLDGGNDPYWNSGIDNRIGASAYSAVGQWFVSCIQNPAYDTTRYPVPNFPAGFEGWVAANNWIVRALAPHGTVTVGWQDNIWAVGSGFWVHQTLSASQVAAIYADPVARFLQANAPSAIDITLATGPDFFVFDRYEMDDSAAPAAATLYNARSWDNYLSAVGQVSRSNHDIPIMLWQIPGSHIPNTAEAAPEIYPAGNGDTGYVFSTAPVYFFGDPDLTPNLGDMVLGPANAAAPIAVGSFAVPCGPTAYNCLVPNATYQAYLLEYGGQANHYDWSSGNGKLAIAANDGVFAILWGGGNTTNVIKNFSNADDHGWLAGKIKAYYANPTPVVVH
ncbi:putative uncharacterized protein [Burkholderiales bacterium GJ-E10]|nr:putative uncharacterized protein [Burkholderiales bacterium GJ-E10]